MSKDPQTENRDGPNIAGYYKQLLSSLLSERETTFSTSNEEKNQIVHHNDKNETDESQNELVQFFNDSFGLDFSENKKEMLDISLRESVSSLNQEADEILSKKVAMLRVESERKEDSVPESSDRKRKAGDFSQDCNDTYSPELYDKLCKMERGLDELLNEITSHCRPMSFGEKQQLGRRIQKLPEKSLDRLMEILKCTNLSTGRISVDLEKQDDVTLWRLYYYVETVLLMQTRSKSFLYRI